MKMNQIIRLIITTLVGLIFSLLLMGKALALSQIYDENSQSISQYRKTLTDAKFCASIENGNVVFRGEGNNNQQGIYLYMNGYLKTIANQNTSIPEGTGKFTQFGICPAFDQDNVVFIAQGSEDQQGIYISIDGFLSKVTNRKTSIPNGQGTFTEFGSCLAIKNESVVFTANGNNNQQGIYIYQGGLLSTIVDRTTFIPGGKGTFTDFGSCAAIDNEKVLFLGYGENNQQGIYTYFNDSLFAIVDINTPIPGGKDSFTSY
ncbi:hypothetical protein [Okeania sp. SIO1I7]|uniref:DUF7453 family protein n=1 Tax=Okeania sp. SIO1I7 TaxID=2607772 RepID=UPI0013F8E64F|nr:hypothetical protein [Okeania sp. SIO1I7]NET28351.1 hypothetical protein [Okeania sp. SIO1I7]